ncbi:MAG: helicase-related protein, partial [Egibacteraceae bacterium]
FPERIATTVAYPLSSLERRLYDAVTAYVIDEMNRAERLAAQGEGRRGNAVGFALTILQRRLASSPEAIYQSLARRRKRLEARVAEELRRPRGHAVPAGLVDEELDPDELDDLPEDERVVLEERLVDQASAARTIAELEAEIATLRNLDGLARRVRNAGEDRKWAELAGLLDGRVELFDSDGRRRKLIVFTEHRDTLDYLVDRLRTYLGRCEAVVAIHGSHSREDRRIAQELFTQDPDCVVLVATDAAGEGINLQRAHLVVNYDLPWNPNRIEQRFGRVHRIGQTEVCHMWNLVAVDTREGQVYARLLAKVEEQRNALGGQVFDVLGEALPGPQLRELLVQAIRYGNRAEVRARLDQVIDGQVGAGLGRLVAEQALAADVMSITDVVRIRAQMEEAEARRLQPHYVRAFFAAAFLLLGGRLREREPGRFEITHVPAELRARDRTLGAGTPVLARYDRITFDKSLLRVDGKPPAEFVAPGHPLLEATVDLVLSRHGSLLQQGAILVDEQDDTEVPAVLLLLEHEIASAVDDGRRVMSRRFEFVLLDAEGGARVGGYAPYLDLRPVRAEEGELLEPLLRADWLCAGLEQRGIDYAIGDAVPGHLDEVRARTVERVAKVRAAVHDRLRREIGYWDQRASELREQATAGKQPRMNPDRAQARADELAARLSRRMAELDREEQLQALPPVLVGGALVVPAGLLARLRGEREAPPEAYALRTAEVERRAVDAVLAIERSLGRDPLEMPHSNPGYDIRSTGTDGHLSFIEVKGRIAGSGTVSVTRNEILHGLNKPDHWLLALVEVRPDGADEVRYLRRPFEGMASDVHFAETNRFYDWRKLWEMAQEPR